MSASLAAKHAFNLRKLANLDRFPDQILGWLNQVTISNHTDCC